jgi:hypothetical protein
VPPGAAFLSQWSYGIMQSLLRFGYISFGALTYLLLQSGLMLVNAQKPTHSYPPEIVSAFTDECAAAAKDIDPATLRSLCLCSINEIQNRYSFEEFRSVAESKEKEKAMSKEFEEISYNCATKVISGQSK